MEPKDARSLVWLNEPCVQAEFLYKILNNILILLYKLACYDLKRGNRNIIIKEGDELHVEISN